MRRAEGWGFVLLGVAATTACNLNPRPEDPGAGGRRSPMGSATGSDGAVAVPEDPIFAGPPLGPPTTGAIADGGVQDGVDAAGVNPLPPVGGDAAIDVTVPDAEALDSPVGP